MSQISGLPMYNGWKNKPTWLVHLWLSNDQASYEIARELANKYQPNQAAAALKELVEEAAPAANDGTLHGDLLSWAIAMVDWNSIYEAFLEN